MDEEDTERMVCVIMRTRNMEPALTYLVLDFLREDETRRCLESIRHHTKFEHKVIYLHNGPAEYPARFLAEGLADTLIQTKKNTGLGIGTRDLFAASFSRYSFYLQNDQFLNRDFTRAEFDELIGLIGREYISPEDGTTWTVASVDLAGGVWGIHNYTERAHLMPTAFYKEMEVSGMLSHYGAGPYDDGPWREEQIQQFYKREKFLHYTYENRFITNFGHRTVRENVDGSLWEMEPDTKRLTLVRGPVKEKASWPRLTDAEWEEVLRTQHWPDGTVPARSADTIEMRWDWGQP
jgi:hypothetical protein